MLAGNRKNYNTLDNNDDEKERSRSSLAAAFENMKQALREERYEYMAELVAAARELGADEWDIRTALSKDGYR